MGGKETKKFREWLKLMPISVCSKYIYALSKDKGGDGIEILETQLDEHSAQGIISCYFNWGGTQEGPSFWNLVDLYFAKYWINGNKKGFEEFSDSEVLEPKLLEFILIEIEVEIGLS